MTLFFRKLWSTGQIDTRNKHRCVAKKSREKKKRTSSTSNIMLETHSQFPLKLNLNHVFPLNTLASTLCASWSLEYHLLELRPHYSHFSLCIAKFIERIISSSMTNRFNNAAMESAISHFLSIHSLYLPIQLRIAFRIRNFPTEHIFRTSNDFIISNKWILLRSFARRNFAQEDTLKTSRFSIMRFDWTQVVWRVLLENSIGNRFAKFGH